VGYAPESPGGANEFARPFLQGFSFTSWDVVEQGFSHWKLTLRLPIFWIYLHFWRGVGDF
jgi:hypothetical protein